MLLFVEMLTTTIKVLKSAAIRDGFAGCDLDGLIQSVFCGVHPILETN